MSEDRELSTVDKMRATRLVQRRADYQADITRQQQEADRGDAWANPDPHERFPAPHKPDLAESFKSFQVLHLIEMKSADGRPNTKAEIGTFEDIRGDVSQSRQMPIEKIRTLPQYVGECWSLVGWSKDSDATTIGDFKTERLARDVLGGITGDRNYDQHPSQDWTLATAWGRFEQEGGFFPPKLADRMTADLSETEHGRVKDAQNLAQADRDHAILAAHGVSSFDPKTIPAEQLPSWRKAVDTMDKAREDEDLTGRPNARLLGQGIERW